MPRSTSVPAAAAYILTNAHRKRVALKVNARELYHIARLRADRHAQWDIRQIAERMIALGKEAMPLTLMLATGMPIMNAISSSLVAVTAFGMTTAASYAWSGLVSWPLAALFVLGGIGGGLIGTRSAKVLSARRGALNVAFAIVIIAVAVYMLVRNLSLS